MIHQYAISIKGLVLQDCNEVMNLISMERVKKANAYYHDEDKIRCILGEAIIRYALKKEYNIKDMEPWILNSYGKPMLAENAKIHFNVSHSGDWVVAAIGYNNIGVDIEKMQTVTEDVYTNVLSVQGKGLAERLEPIKLEEYFIRKWTIKEAYTKTLGMGLSKSFPSIEVKFQNSNNIKIFDNGNFMNDYYVIQNIFNDNYCYALCVEGAFSEVRDLEYITINRMAELLKE